MTAESPHYQNQADVLNKDAKREASRFLDTEIQRLKAEEKSTSKKRTETENPVSDALKNFQYIDTLRQNPYINKVVRSKKDLGVLVERIILGNGILDDSIWLRARNIDFYIGAGMGRGRSVNALDADALTQEYATDSSARGKINKWAKQKKSDIARKIKNKL